MGLHSSLTGTDLHEAFHYVQTSDPGAVGAGKYWLDTTSAPYELKRRNAGNSAWVTVGASGGSVPTLVSDKKSLTSGNKTGLSGTTFAVIDTGLNITLTTGARRCNVAWTLAGLNTSGSANNAVDVEIDSSRVGGTYGLITMYAPGANGNFNLSGTFLTDVLTAASHTFKLMFRVDGGTATLFASASVCPIIFSVVELL